ncbi:OmpH family outer membrane protein [Alteraurantiacibacter aquimixticola]|uniref:OmpH family outer membrane protein n=1 Tax=Alteraurantiacibacter aquimixticola TaxID=2489173 RepID=A0A4T3F693_9SPHN|nr:OmpH family outer membrane protein [Alteraurantiacibacter aquimixticola]TIX51944.1 OmpH family outer membrane protein [Alteraurantiacibacter aquimixticola]
MFSKTSKSALAATALAGVSLALSAAPAQAQINGMASADIGVAVAGSQPLQSGYEQIRTTYQAQITQAEQLVQQRQGLIQQLDTNGNGQLDEAEQAALNDSNPTVQQINTIDQQIAQVQAPIQLAQLYVVNQVGQQYAPASQQVMSDRNIQIMLAPEAIDFAADGINVTPAVIEAINARLPNVSITPPQGWQPNQATIQLMQQVQQVRAIVAAQQQQAAAPAANGATPPR